MAAVTANRPSTAGPYPRSVADVGSRLEAVEQQLDSTLERLVWRPRSAVGLQQPIGTTARSRDRRAAATARPRLSLVGSSARL
jgi:hypothetical protein